MTATARRRALAALLLLAAPAVGLAHTGGSTGYAVITVSRGTVRYEATLPTTVLPSDLAEALRLAQGGHAPSREPLLDVVRKHVVLRADDVRCEPGPGEVSPGAFPAPTFTMRVDFACGRAPRELTVQDDTFDVLGPDHHTLARIEAPGTTQQFAFAPETRVARFPIETAPAASHSTGSFVLLGIHHILSGYDHLLFVIGLLFLVGFQRRLLWTITAFTAAHSLTLACSVFGWITLRPPPVEAAIAMSIVLVASEALRKEETLARRLPALVSFLFGLVHGLGFAGALKDVGLPQNHLPFALLSFNVGVEIGQLMVVLAAFLLVRAPLPQRWFIGARRPALYAVGIVAAYWSWSRISAIVF